MSEPRPAPGPQDSGPPPTPPAPELITDLFAGAEGEPQDDAPTIISKAAPQPARLEDAFAGTLRGRTLAHFELIEPIGVGGMAAVIRARDLHLDRFVALKILPPEMANDPENVRRFHQEARAAARLDHENIARVFYCGEDQRLHFIAFEFVEGDNLRVILERRGRLPVSEAVHCMLQIATGLAHASARGVVHRDIKPSNIIISPNGRAKLVDMGLARSLDPKGDNGLTQSGVTLGTFDYISPEQALEPRDADVRSDLYSLGCTFYHMLTGQPPVPEGTAARKLYHHQHVAPLDPRQLNPAIPDEVAAILGRMMAKDPKDRYQRAEHLVQHLIQVAQRQGVAAEAPDAVLFVDAPLPSPPHRRPALVAALAALSLVGLLALLSLAPSNTGPREPGPDGPPDVPREAERPARDVARDNPRPPQPPANEPGLFSVSRPADLAKALAARPKVKRVLLAGNLDLLPKSGEAPAAFLYAGGADGELTVGPAGPRKPVTIDLGYAPSAGEGKAWVGLTFAGGKVTVRDVRFVIHGGPGEEDPAAAVRAALAVKAGTLALQRCAFAFADTAPPPASRTDPAVTLAAVALKASRSTGPRLTLDGCYFEGGPGAVDVAGPASLEAANCAFGPHLALVRLHGPSRVANTELHLRNCSAFLVDGPAFRLEGSAGCRFRVEDSVFSCPAGSSGSAADLLLQTGTQRKNVCYTGRRNVYHNLNALWVRGPETADPKPINELGEFRAEIARAAPLRGRDDLSDVLGEDKIPWAAGNPFDLIAAPERAFRLKTDMPQLRQEAPRQNQMIGALVCLGRSLYPEPLAPLAEPNPAVQPRKGVRVVDPDVQTTGGGVYRSLATALEEAEAGDEIQIRSNGRVEINWRGKDLAGLVLKPFKNFHPVLVLKESPEKKAALFRLYDGKVRFEGLEFELQPNRAELDFQAVVEVVGNGRCDFRRCVFTLLKAAKTPEKRPSVVRLIDPGEAMKMSTDPAPDTPEVAFQDCLVRGQGDLVAVCPSRPLELEVGNSLVALDGSLLNADGTPKGSAAAPSGSGTNDQVIRLDHVLTYLTDSLLVLRARGGKGLVPTVVKKATDCLFVAAGSRPLVRLDGLDSEQQAARLFVWENGTHNAYLNFDKMLDSPQSSIDQGVWKNAVNDQEPVFSTGKVKLEETLAAARPGDFQDLKADDPEMELQKYGPDFDNLPNPEPREPPAADNPDGGEKQEGGRDPSP